MGWWEDCAGEILGGRDEVAGGTWLACSKGGRVALLTNVLELHSLPEARTRGDLPLLFLQVNIYMTLSAYHLKNFYSSNNLMFLFMMAEQKESKGICGGTGKRVPSV